MPDTTPPTCPNVPPHSLIGGPENMKLLFDNTQRALFNDRDEHLARARAWEAIALDQAQIASRRAQQAATFDHFVNMMAASAGQTGTVEGQSQVTPIRTGAADSQVQVPPGAAYTPNRVVDTLDAQGAGSQTAALADISASMAAIGQTLANVQAALGVLITASTGPSAAAAGK